MDASKQTSVALIERANADIAQLLRRFENIIALAPVSDHDPQTTAMETFQMEVETAALVRSAEDILSLTRSLKEAWLFGKLDTIGRSEAEARTDRSAREVVEGFRALIEGHRVVESHEKDTGKAEEDLG
ncbi:hypothetical protein MMC13_006857 [Lambiella insularis]|nr:hypothetical protein [Lambiella insularis]